MVLIIKLKYLKFIRWNLKKGNVRNYQVDYIPIGMGCLGEVVK